MSRPKYNTNDIAKTKDLEDDRVIAAIEWIEAVLGKSYGATADDGFANFFGGRNCTLKQRIEDKKSVGIRDGVDLCDLVNKIKPESTTNNKYKASTHSAVCRENIGQFTKACERLGIRQTDTMASRDLFDHANLPKVIDNIYALDRIAAQNGFSGPSIPGNAKYAKKNVRHFDAATLAKSKSAIPQMAKGGIYQKTNNQDGYGIVKTDKSMQNPSNVQSVWAKGAKKVDNKNMDGYGIVKTDKSMQNPSQVQSAWQKGSFKVDNKGMDGYGIVKTDKSMQNPSQVQSVWAKGAKKVENNNMDGYGIVKTDKDMQQPSQVQGVWQQGAKKNENSGMDGYGIVKVDENMQNPSQVQGAWQQGANANENQGMDSYGIVKQSQD